MIHQEIDSSDTDARLTSIELRQPIDLDGLEVHRLIGNCPPLDPNSIYCNLLQCAHFANTSVIAIDQQNNDVLGFISGYLKPNDQSTLFIWQVAVSSRARGKGLAKKMLNDILTRNLAIQLSYLETTITKGNEGSWALFQRIAKDLNTELVDSPLFTKSLHFQGLHDTEHLVRIGPFQL